MRAILTYHSIDDSGSPISVHPDAFRRHVDWLTSGRVKATTLDELLTLPSASNAVAITFDDGFENFEEHGRRLLERGVPITLFVVSERVGKTNAWGDMASPGIPVLPLLDWPALRRLREEGVSLGAHSRTHVDLTGLTKRLLEDEIRGSADAIVRETGARPTAFAYPYGHVNDAAAAMVADAFRFGCTTDFQILRDGARSERLPRLDMYYMQRPGRIEGWGTPAFARFVSVRHKLRQVKQAVLRVRRSRKRMLS
jgi:peptidoglycan/xylan/chitin deacetylase (PgdA/CDA1 family)